MPTIMVLDEDRETVCSLTSHLAAQLPNACVIPVFDYQAARYAAVACRPEVAIVDIGIERGRGETLTWELVSLLPDTKVVAGVVAGTIHGDRLTTVVHRVVPKPYELTLMTATVHELLCASAKLVVAKTAGQAEHRVDRHRLRNRFAGLVVGIKAFSVELNAAASDPIEVQDVIDEYIGRLTAIVSDLMVMHAVMQDEES